jgi:hypothetical protein
LYREHTHLKGSIHLKVYFVHHSSGSLETRPIAGKDNNC